MSKSDQKLEINDILSELRNENERLVRELSDANVCLQLLIKYRNCLLSFSECCVCVQNVVNRQQFNDLEFDYKQMMCKGLTTESTCDEELVVNNEDKFSIAVDDSLVLSEDFEERRVEECEANESEFKLNNSNNTRNQRVSTKQQFMRFEKNANQKLVLGMD